MGLRLSTRLNPAMGLCCPYPRLGEKSCFWGISVFQWYKREESHDGRVLCQVQVEEGDAGRPEGHHEERAPCHEGNVPGMRDGALPDSQHQVERRLDSWQVVLRPERSGPAI